MVPELSAKDVDLETGKLRDTANVHEYEAPFVRCRKQMSFLKPEDNRKIFENSVYRLDCAKERKGIHRPSQALVRLPREALRRRIRELILK